MLRAVFARVFNVYYRVVNTTCSDPDTLCSYLQLHDWNSKEWWGSVYGRREAYRHIVGVYLVYSGKCIRVPELSKWGFNKGVYLILEVIKS